MRLFVALDLPPQIRTALANAGISPARGVRIVSPAHMHVTLRFIGDADADRIRPALRPVCCRPFGLSVRGVGRFRLRDGRTILWAGISRTDALVELYDACRDALSAIGFEAGNDRFVPHVTLARLKPFAKKSIVESFLRTGEELEFGSFVAERFVLYHSTTRDDAVEYQAIESYPLK